MPKVLSPLTTVKCYPQEKMSKSVPQMIKYDSKHSYIIVGTSVKDNKWFQLVEWLMTQGARKFMIVLEKCALLSRIEHQINRLLAERNVKILLTSVSKLDTKQETYSLLQETENLAPLEAVFFVSIKINGKKIANLHRAVSPDVCFVGLFSTGLKEFERRHSDGSPAIFIHSDKSQNILPVLPHLNELLTQDVNNNAEILYQTTDTICNNVQIIQPSLSDYLPQDIETLIKIGREKYEELTFIETTTLSRRYSCCKGVYPIFALPALHSIILQPLFQRLLYPVFSATAVSIRSTKEAAHKLYQSLNEIQPSGPVTIISETWTLPLALELVSYAQLVNRKYKVCVLEGNPKNWSDQVKRLQSLDPEKSNTTYADEIFHFTNKENYRSNGSISFESKVKTLAKNASCDVRTVENVIRASKLIKDKISELVPMTFASKLLKNTIWFERYRPDYRDFNLSVTSKMVVLNELNYRDLLNNPKVSKTINENAEFSFWEYTNLNDTR